MLVRRVFIIVRLNDGPVLLRYGFHGDFGFLEEPVEPLNLTTPCLLRIRKGCRLDALPIGAKTLRSIIDATNHIMYMIRQGNYFQPCLGLPTYTLCTGTVRAGIVCGGDYT